MSPSRAAVVVVFQQRTGYVDECLSHLRQMHGGPWDLYIVPDAAVPAYDSLGTQIVCPGTIGRKRNAALARCTNHEFIAFIDSDAFPDKHWLERAVNHLAPAEPGVVAVTGPNLNPPGDSGWRNICGWALASPLIMADSALFYSAAGSAQPVRKAFACNLIVRNSALSAAGNFSESLMTNEDIALTNCLREQGGKILFHPDVVVFHHRRDVPHFLLQWFNEGLGFRDYWRFSHLPNLWTSLPLLALLAEMAVGLLAGGKAWAGLQLLPWLFFFVERLKVLKSPVRAAGAACLMGGFVKAYGLGSLAGLALWRRPYLNSRSDPPTP